MATIWLSVNLLFLFGLFLSVGPHPLISVAYLVGEITQRRQKATLPDSQRQLLKVATFSNEVLSMNFVFRAGAEKLDSEISASLAQLMAA